MLDYAPDLGIQTHGFGKSSSCKRSIFLTKGKPCDQGLKFAEELRTQEPYSLFLLSLKGADWGSTHKKQILC